MNNIVRSASMAFGLLELLVTITIMGILVVISISVIFKIIDTSHQAKCVNNLRQIGVATFQYAQDNNGETPFKYYKTVEGNYGSGSIGGMWYYHLAPYLGVPRVENITNYSSWDRNFLGTDSQPISKPCVFTCPAHKKEESNDFWQPTPMAFPTRNPISYAPTSFLVSERRTSYMDELGYTQYPAVRLLEVVAPSRKVWLTDSSVVRSWTVVPSDEIPPSKTKNKYFYEGMTRHNNGGNALFFDGHVEWLPFSLFSTVGRIAKNSYYYFSITRSPEMDQ